MRTIIYSCLGAVALMLGVQTILNAEKLVTEDGTVSATKLPFDQKTAEVNYKTATFGIG